MGTPECTDPDTYYDAWWDECVTQDGPEPPPDDPPDDPSDDPSGGGSGDDGDDNDGPDLNLPDGAEAPVFDDAPLDDLEIIQDTIDCTNPVHTQNQAIAAWCSGDPVQQTVHWSHIDDALDRISDRGPLCAGLATLGRDLVARNRFRINDNMGHQGWGDDRLDFLVVNTDNVTTHLNDMTWGGARYLDFVLAHELDHVNGENMHVIEPGFESAGNETFTAHSLICGGGGM